ncbi:ankyrin repeat domain-containing protein 1-like [Plakobranchus ocellatus]|uniref:Ankyrin repeat domain-containing protein 1-like n=1 Tax=Plakobranchus ocellatus TaxID=259542 RepID=A0AAV3Y1Q7_9GAST|nr:ankyrin repeat domain-containing protein 1-like [Plakobranchus ocellatus]
MAHQVKQNPHLLDFFNAVKLQDCDKVKKMLKQREVDVEDVDLRDPVRPTAIILASELGHVDMVHTLMKAKPKHADVNAETKLGRRAIWWAAMKKDLELAKQLLTDKTCEVNVVDKETGCTPLYRAIISNCASVARELVHAGADVNIHRLGFDVGAETPLIKSVQMNNIEISDLLINSMCNINAKTEEGLTALHYAVAYRRYDICELLLQSRIKVHAKSNHGVTAMTVAIEQHNPHMVRLLIQFGYKLDKSYSWGETPLEQAIKIHSLESALTLLHWGSSLKRKRGRPSYFQLAVTEKQWAVVKFLIHLYPSYLQETWLRKQQWPVAIYHREDVRQYLLDARCYVWTLKQLCRARVFRLVGKYAPVKVDKLPLPAPLKDYLKFSEFVKESFYEKVPLETVECPFDCPAICPKKGCPDLDISISSDSGSDFEI